MFSKYLEELKDRYKIKEVKPSIKLGAQATTSIATSSLDEKFFKKRYRFGRKNIISQSYNEIVAYRVLEEINKAASGILRVPPAPIPMDVDFEIAAMLKIDGNKEYWRFIPTVTTSAAPTAKESWESSDDTSDQKTRVSDFLSVRFDIPNYIISNHDTHAGNIIKIGGRRSGYAIDFGLALFIPVKEGAPYRELKFQIDDPAKEDDKEVYKRQVASNRRNYKKLIDFYIQALQVKKSKLEKIPEQVFQEFMTKIEKANRDTLEDVLKVQYKKVKKELEDRKEKTEKVLKNNISILQKDLKKVKKDKDL